MQERREKRRKVPVRRAARCWLEERWQEEEQPRAIVRPSTGAKSATEALSASVCEQREN